jgi:cytochrome P450 / NADPH-cytochrome P450 reductase
MRESLRLSPTAFARTVVPKEDTTLCGGKYAVKAGTRVVLQNTITQRDPAVWGEDVSSRLSIDAIISVLIPGI